MFGLEKIDLFSQDKKTDWIFHEALIFSSLYSWQMRESCVNYQERKKIKIASGITLHIVERILYYTIVVSMAYYIPGLCISEWGYREYNETNTC